MIASVKLPAVSARRLGLHPAALRRRVEELLAKADVAINGVRPWDIRVHEDGLYARVLAEGALGLGESYMDGWWDCDQLDEFFRRILAAELDRQVKPTADLLRVARAKLLNRQNPRRAYEIGRRHYDIGNDLYERMLDERMIYSCGYWKDAATLDEAQEAKLDLVCRKLGLTSGMRVLDIGCGWGGTARFAAERYGVEVMGITVSKEQASHAEELCRGLPVEIRLQDYRDLEGLYDRVLSLGMIEHVGYKNYRTYLEAVRRCLGDDGLFLVQTIGGNASVTRTNAWTERYIFPNSMLPSAQQITEAAEGLFVLEDWHSFGADYDKTLLSWHRNFEAAWPALRKEYGDRFYRMWRYYLLSSAGGFRARSTQLWQIVLSPKGVPGGYRSVR
ncbi:MAG: cyclopropane fatty acyl phospholipid synthase [Gemmatimonadales bacterium]|jgi:cyclopropane-fatty-acyl-phospholipid synthase